MSMQERFSVLLLDKNNRLTLAGNENATKNDSKIELAIFNTSRCSMILRVLEIYKLHRMILLDFVFKTLFQLTVTRLIFFFFIHVIQ